MGPVERTAGTADLLVVRHDRARCLVVDHEAEIRFVEAHPERGRRRQCLHAVLEQRLFKSLAPFSRLSGVGFHRQPLRPEPFRHPIRIPDGERVDDPAAGQSGKLLRKPRQPLRLAGQSYRLEHERRPVEIAPEHLQVRAEHRGEIAHHPIVRGRGGREKPEVRRKGACDPLDQPVVGPEVVAPVRDAVGFVDDEKADAFGNLRQHLGPEVFVAEPLGGDEQDVRLVAPQAFFRVLPVFPVVRSDPGPRGPPSARRRRSGSASGRAAGR